MFRFHKKPQRRYGGPPRRLRVEKRYGSGVLSRFDFKAAVFNRDDHKCVFCNKTAVDAHHIMDRKLWADGGYYLDNGASVCADCHWKCERDEILPDEVRQACGIDRVLLPPGLDETKHYDKWGKEI